MTTPRTPPQRDGQGASLPADAAEAADAVEVAYISDAFGLRGEIKLQAHSGDGAALCSAKRWWLAPRQLPLGAVKKPASALPAQPRAYTCLRVRSHGEGWVAQLEGVDDRDAAEALRGSVVLVSRADFPQTAGDDEFYWVDLIGLAVVNRQGEPLGEVVGLIDTGPHCVLRVQPPPSEEAKPREECLIPFVAAYIDSVSLADRLICADWGLDY